MTIYFAKKIVTHQFEHVLQVQPIAKTQIRIYFWNVSWRQSRMAYIPLSSSLPCELSVAVSLFSFLEYFFNKIPPVTSIQVQVQRHQTHHHKNQTLCHHLSFKFFGISTYETHKFTKHTTINENDKIPISSSSSIQAGYTTYSRLPYHGQRNAAKRVSRNVPPQCSWVWPIKAAHTGKSDYSCHGWATQPMIERLAESKLMPSTVNWQVEEEVGWGSGSLSVILLSHSSETAEWCLPPRCPPVFPLSHSKHSVSIEQAYRSTAQQY